MSQPLLCRDYQQLQVKVFADRQALGLSAGLDAAAHLRHLLAHQPRVRVIFAAAPSQNECLTTLAAAEGIDWSRVEAFHMDEYIGLAPGAPQLFSQYLDRQLFNRVKPGKFYRIPAIGPAAVICHEYGEIIAQAPIDMVCLGVGENGHLAFNEPSVADFNDPLRMKVVPLDAVCRQQQVNDGCFARLAQVPEQAVTLTLPTLLSARRLFCMVPGASKANALRAMLTQPPSADCPASALRAHSGCTLYTDRDAWGTLTDE